MNPLLILGPIGAAAVGILSIALWRSARSVALSCFLVGGLAWLASLLPKVAMDLTVTPTFASWAESALGVPACLALLGAYVGLRTGLLECGVAYLLFSKTRLRRYSLDEAVAFGVGFGAFEAILISAPAIVQIAVLTANPSLLELLSEEQRRLVEAQLSMPTWVVLAPVIERASAVLIHTCAALATFASATRSRVGYLVVAIAYKSAADAPLPLLHWLLKPAESPVGMYQAEAWAAAMGLLGLLGARSLLRELREPPGSRDALAETR